MITQKQIRRLDVILWVMALVLFIGVVILSFEIFGSKEVNLTYKECLINTASDYCEAVGDSYGGLRKNDTIFMCNDHSNLRTNPKITSAYGIYFLPHEINKCLAKLG